jgi:PTH2 family peptidyl-tRNA hydrolase
VVYLKQAIVVRTDLKMGKGKIAAEVAHASLGALKVAERKKVALWEIEGQKKIVVKVGSLQELKSLCKRAGSQGLPCFLVSDAGLTQVESGSETALGIGPDEDGKIDRITKDLKLL